MPNFFSQIYRDARIRVKKKIFKKIDLPWMKTKELDILSELLDKLQPAYCFEWGSGYSSLYFPSKLHSLKLWYALEHNQKWFEHISVLNTNELVKMKFIPPINFEIVKSKGYTWQKEGTYDQFKDYVDYPATLLVKFDFMFIDGRARTACLKQAYDLLSEDGVVVLHDANRENYFVDPPPFKHILRFKDFRQAAGGILIASKNRSLDTVINIPGHEAAWKKHAIVDKLLRKR